MSSLNPLVRGVASANPADAVALEIAALKADAEALRGLLADGDIVAAKVLPFNGLTDLIAILGKRVAASLPPTVRPGDTLILQVVGFDGDRILVRNLGVESQQAPEQNVPASAEEEPAYYTAAFDGTGLAQALTQPAAPDSTGEQAPAETAEGSDDEAPASAAPRTVFVDAAVQQTITNADPPTPPPSPSVYPRVTIAVPPKAIETDQSIEARLIAARAAAKVPASSPSAKPATAPTSADAERAPAPAAGTVPRQGAAPPSSLARGTGASPPRTPAWITNAALRAGREPAQSSQPAVRRATAEPRANAAEPSSAANAVRARPELASPPPRTAALYREPALLLRSLRIPVTPTNVAAAKMALENPQRLPAALATLERALPLGTADPRVNTMRTLAAFVANLDPQSEAFPAQLSSYISHVLDGPEPKLVTVLRQLAQAFEQDDIRRDSPAPPGASNPSPESPLKTPDSMGRPAPAQQAGTQDPNSIAQRDPAAAARIVERSAAMDADLKTQLQSFVAQPPANASQASIAAAQAALTALTAAQLANALAQQDPRAVTITLPLPLGTDGEGARIKISRDKPQERGERLDSDNFHIAFVLDTKNVGTVAIDLQTVGRAVNVAVKSETPGYAAALRTHLNELGGRLESLRYNVVSLESEVVSRAGETVATASAPAAPQRQDDEPSGLDLQA